MWIYYETDGDSGWYSVKLFSSQQFAMQYKNDKGDAYGCVEEIPVDNIKAPIYEDVKCPECGGPMVSRKGTYGIFWGCKKYPNCRGTRDSMGRSKAERDAEKDKEPVSHQDGFPFRRT